MKQNKLLHNLAYNVTYHILILIVPFITAPYVSRILHPEGLGTYSVTTAIAKYFWMFGLLGMSKHGNRLIASVRDNAERLSEEFSNLFYFQLMISSLSTAIFLLYIFLFGYSQYDIVIVCQIPYLLAAVFDVTWFFSGTEQFQSMVLKNAIIKIVSTAAVFFFVKNKEDVWVYVLINTLSLFAGQICLWPLLLKQVKFHKPDFHKIMRHLRPNLVLTVSVIAVSIYVMMDKIMIEWLSSRIHVGYYENTEKILNMSTGIVGAIGTVMLPRMAYLMTNGDKDHALNYLSKSMRYIMTFAIAIAFGVASIAKEFSVLYFGKEFEICGITIPIISVAILFYSWENIMKTQYLLPKSKDKIYVKGTIAAAICNLFLNYLLIPRLGVIGAVIGTVGAQAASAVYESICVRKQLPIKQYILDLLPLVLIGALMFLTCRLIGVKMGSEWLTIVTQIVVGALIFVLLTFLYYLHIKDELVMKILKKSSASKV